MNIPRFGLALALASLTAVAHAHGDAALSGKKHALHTSSVEELAFGRAGDPGNVNRTISVDMRDDFRFTPSGFVVRRGETVRFLITNSGQLLHELVLGTSQGLDDHADMMRKSPAMAHDEANTVHVRPGATGEIVWQFTQAGEFSFACLLPGHFEAGMTGKVIVK